MRPVRRVLVAARLLAAVAAAAASPVRAEAQVVEGIQPDGAEGRLVSALDRPLQAVVTAILADARRRGLPADPIVAKALEGVEKGATAQRIEHAVRTMLTRLDAARSALAPSVGDAEVVAGADALALGVPPDVLRRIRKISPQRSTAVALGVLAQLVSRKVPVSRATDAVISLMRSGAQPAQILALDGAVQADIAAGIPPDQSLDLRWRERIAGLPGASTTTTTVGEAADFGTPAAVGRGGGGAPAAPTPTAPAAPTVPTPPTVPTNAPPPGP